MPHRSWIDAIDVRTNVVLLSCAISAGIHGALVADHFEEGTGAGPGFVVATVLLATLAVLLTHTPTQRAFAVTAAVLAGLIGSYVLATTTGLPLLHPERETVDGLAIFTKAVEVVGLIASASLVTPPLLRGMVIQPKGNDDMSKTRASRPIPIALTALVAFVAALAALAVSNRMDMAQAHDNEPHQGQMQMPTAHRHSLLTAKAVALRMDMRKLWEDHITWTRLAIISLTTDSPDTQATVDRLLQNQTDIGNAVKPYYGTAAGDELTRQLRAHILIAAEVIAAARAGDSAKLADAQARWVQNADVIAAVLHSVNPRNWPLAEMKEMMHRHLDLTTQEVVARLQGDWSADVAAYDCVHGQILQMADMLSEGIIKQFPKQFR